MAAKQDLYGLLFEGCSTLSKNRKRNDLIGYHLKSLKVSGQISLLIGYHLKEENLIQWLKTDCSRRLPIRRKIFRQG